MELYQVLSLIGGLAFFLFGMHTMSSSLSKMASGGLERTLKKVTSNPILSLLLGVVITVAMQSSSATTVMLVGLVSSGLMQFSQTIYVILGANVGTTLTAWILSLSGIQNEAVWVQMLKPSHFSPIVAIIGIVLLMFTKTDKKKTVGTVMIGFALLMFGMTLMSDSVSGLAAKPEFEEVLRSLANPYLGLFVSLGFTAVVQSSAATIGVLQAISLSGGMSYSMAIPMVMGLNIGTCATSLISCIGANTNAKRVAVSHLTIKILGALVGLPVFLLLEHFGLLPFAADAVSPWGIALIHTVYNLILTLLFLPLAKPLTKLVEKLVREKKKDAREEVFTLDERLLRVPSVAIAECANKTGEMCTIACGILQDSFEILFGYKKEIAAKIEEQENKLDLLEDKLGTYLVPLGTKNLSVADSRKVSEMLHTIGDFERLGDHAVNLMKVSREIAEKQIVFSENAMKEIQTAIAAAAEILDLTEEAYRTGNVELARKVEPLEQVIDRLIASTKDHHIDRLVAGNCTIEHGFVLSDILTNIERISDHCSNVAVALIELGRNSFETHRYLNGVKSGNEEFEELYEGYAERYGVL